MANELTLTLTGWVDTEPRYVIGPSGESVCTLRIVTAERHFDRDTGTWEQGKTEWFTARAFRATAAHVRDSIKKGDPVIVTGQLRTHTWQSEDGSRMDLILNITAIGHDLTKGVATFTHATTDADTDADTNAA